MIYIILILAFILRVIKLNQSLWLDEAININAIRGLGFKDIVFNYSLGDFHPPLYHVLLKIWMLIFPVSEISIRMMSVILGVATIFITYKIAKAIFEKKTALISAALLSTAPLHIYYSQEARMYMLASFFASLSVYFFVLIIKKDNLYLWVGFITSTVLMLYSDYLPYLLIPAYMIYLLLLKKTINKSTLASFVPGFLLIFGLIIPWLMIFPKQFATGISVAAISPAWAQVVGSPSIKTLVVTFVKFAIGRISVENNLIYGLLFAPIAIFISSMFVVSIFRMSKARLFLWLWLVGPIILGFIIAFFVPIFAYFRFIFVLPAFYIIVASAINSVNIQKLTKTLFVFALTINLASLSIYFIYPKFQRENWKAATDYVLNNSSQNSIVLFESAYSMAPFDYYNQEKIETAGALNAFNAERKNVEENVSKLTTGKDQVFLFQYLSGITDPSGILFEKISETGFKNISTVDFAGVGFVYEFRH